MGVLPIDSREDAWKAASPVGAASDIRDKLGLAYVTPSPAPPPPAPQQSKVLNDPDDVFGPATVF
jgi:hypothetical protein